MKIFLSFLLMLALDSNAFAVDNPDLSKVDQHLFNTAPLVIRARVHDGAEGSKYLFVKIDVLSVLKAPPNVKLPSQMFVGYLSFGPGLPTGVSTLYLAPYYSDPKNGWALLEELDPKSLNKGYSNHEKSTQ